MLSFKLFFLFLGNNDSYGGLINLNAESLGCKIYLLFSSLNTLGCTLISSLSLFFEERDYDDMESLISTITSGNSFKTL